MTSELGGVIGFYARAYPVQHRLRERKRSLGIGQDFALRSSLARLLRSARSDRDTGIVGMEIVR